LLIYLEITVELENKIRHIVLEKISMNLLGPMFFYKYNYDLLDVNLGGVNIKMTTDDD